MYFDSFFFFFFGGKKHITNSPSQPVSRCTVQYCQPHAWYGASGPWRVLGILKSLSENFNICGPLSMVCFFFCFQSFSFVFGQFQLNAGHSVLKSVKALSDVFFLQREFKFLWVGR